MQNEYSPVPRIEKRCGAEDISSLGAFPCGETVDIIARVPRVLGVTSVALCIRRDRLAPADEMLDGAARTACFEYVSTDYVNDEYKLSLDTAALCGESNSGLFYYTYIFRQGKDSLLASATDNVNFTLVRENWQEFRLTVYRPDFKVPEWLGGGIMYHISSTALQRAREGSAIAPTPSLTPIGRAVYRSMQNIEVLRSKTTTFSAEIFGELSKSSTISSRSA